MFRMKPERGSRQKEIMLWIQGRGVIKREENVDRHKQLLDNGILFCDGLKETNYSWPKEKYCWSYSLPGYLAYKSSRKLATEVLPCITAKSSTSSYIRDSELIDTSNPFLEKATTACVDFASLNKRKNRCWKHGDCLEVLLNFFWKCYSFRNTLKLYFLCF